MNGQVAANCQETKERKTSTRNKGAIEAKAKRMRRRRHLQRTALLFAKRQRAAPQRKPEEDWGANKNSSKRLNNYRIKLYPKTKKMPKHKWELPSLQRARDVLCQNIKAHNSAAAIEQVLGNRILKKRCFGEWTPRIKGCSKMLQATFSFCSYKRWVRESPF